MRVANYNLSKDFLEEQYINQGKSAETIAKEFGINSSSTIFNNLAKHNIPRRKGTESKAKKKLRGKGCGELSGSYLYMIKFRAIRQGYDFNLTAEYLWNLYLSQNRQCALSGLDICFPVIWSSTTKFSQTASLDRIDSSKGYVKGNVQWTHKDINKMKWDKSDCDFIGLCRLVTSHNKGKRCS